MQDLDNLTYDQLKSLYWEKGGPKFTIKDTSQQSVDYGRDRMLGYLKSHKDYKQPETEKKKEIPSDVSSFLSTGNEKHAKFLYNKLLDRKLITKKGAGEYENWVTHAKNNPKYRLKLHSFLKAKNLVTSDFNTWNKSLFGDELKDPKEIENPDEEQQLIDDLLGTGEVEAADPRDIKKYVVVENMDIDVAKNYNELATTTEGTNYEKRVKALQQTIDELLLGGGEVPVDENGNTDFEALQNKLDNIQASFPKGLEFKYDVNDLSLYVDHNSRFDKNYNLRKNYMTDKFINDISLKHKDLSDEEFLERTGIDRNDLRPGILSYTNDENPYDGIDYINTREGGTDPFVSPHPSQRSEPSYDYWVSQEGRAAAEKIKTDYINKQKERYDAYIRGDLELSAEELSELSITDPEAEAYIKTKLPEIADIKNEDDFMKMINPDTGEKYTYDEAKAAGEAEMVTAYSDTLNKAMKDDPRMQFISEQVQKQVMEEAQQYTLDLRDRYQDEDGNISEEDQLLMEKDFVDWYNNTYKEKLTENESLGRLYKEYGVITNDLFGEFAQKYKRYNYDSWLDSNVLREIDEVRSGKGDILDNLFTGAVDMFSFGNMDFQTYREAAVDTGIQMKATMNKLEIALQEGFELEDRFERYDSVKQGLKDGENLELLKDLQYKGVFNNDDYVIWDEEKGKYILDDRPYDAYDGERRTLQQRIDGALTRDMTVGEARKINQQVDDYQKWWSLWDDDDSLGAFFDQRKSRYDNTIADITEDLEELADAEEWSTLIDRDKLEDSTVAQLISQAPHMLPMVVGGILQTVGTAAAPFTAGGSSALIPAGIALQAAGSLYMGGQVYGDTFIEGTRRQMQKEFGEDGFTTEEYIQAMQQDRYGAQLAPVMSAAGTTLSEFVAGYAGARLTGNMSATLLKNAAARGLMQNVFSRWLTRSGITLAALPIDSAIEAATEGFQGYMGQVAINTMQLGEGMDMAGKGIGAVLTENIDLEAIAKEAEMGWRIGMLTGGVGGAISSFQNVNVAAAQNNMYTDQAQKIVENYNMSTPGSKSFMIADDAFKMMKEQIDADNLLSMPTKRSIINNISAIREAAMKVPATVTERKARIRLQNLIQRKKNLENEIKRIDDRVINEANGNTQDLNDVNREIKEIIETYQTPREGTIKNSIIDLDGLFDTIGLGKETKKQNKLDTDIDKARAGDIEAQERLEKYGIDWTDENVYRYVGQSEVDAILEGKTIEGRRQKDRIDVTTSDEVSTGVDSDYRITYKKDKGFDIAKTDSRVQIKNKELGDGWLKGSYTKDDVAKIEKRNADGSYTTVYEADTDTGADTDTDTEIQVDDSNDGINETLLETIKDDSISQAARNQAQEALINNNQNLYLEAIRFSKEAGTIPRNRVLEAINSRLGPIINNFDPSKGVTWSTYVTNSLKPKAQEIYEEASIGRRGQSLDREEAREVADTEEQVDFDEGQVSEAREKVYSSQTDQVQDQDVSETKAIIKDELQKDILLAANKGDNPATTASIIKENAKKDYFKQLRKDIGTFASQAYKDFVNSFDSDFIKSVPAATIKRRFGKLFGIKKIGTTKTKQVGKSGKISRFDKPVYSIPQITQQGLQEFKDYFLAGEKRQQSLYQILANDFALESLNELSQDTDFMAKLETALSDSEITAAEFMETLENKLDPRTKEDTSLDVVDAQPQPQQLEGIAVIDNLIEQNREIGNRILAARNEQQLKQRKAEIQNLETQNSADELRALLENATGEDRQNIELAIQEKFKNFPQAVEDAGIDVITGQEAAAGGSPPPGPIDGRRAIKERDKKKSREQLAKERLQKKIDKAKNKVKLEDSDTYFEFTRDGEGTSLSSILGFKKIPVKKEKYIGQRGKTKGKQKSRIIYDLDQLSEIASKEDASTKLTFRELREEGINEFLDTIEDPAKRKKYTELLKSSMTGSKRLNFNTVSEFDNAIPGAEGSTLEQNRTRYKNKKGTLDTNAVDIVYSEQNLDDVLDLFDDLGSFLREGDNMKYLPVFDSIIDDSGNNMNHMVRIAAPYAFYPIDINTGKPDFTSRIDEEHSLPAQNLARLLLYGAATDQMSIIKPIVKGSYIQGAMLATEHAALANQGLKSKMNEAFNLVFTGLRDGNISKVYQGLGSLVRYTDSNVINPNQYILTKHGVTIAEYYGVQVDKRFRKVPNVIEVQNQAITRLQQGENKATVLKDFAVSLKIAKDAAAQNLNIQEYTEQILEKRCTSPCRVPRTSKQVKKTLLNSLIAKIKGLKIFKQRKGLSAFDMDDTLALTKEKVLYTMPDGTKGELTAGEFAVEYEGLSEQGAEFDYRNFDNVDLSTEKGPLAGTALRRQGKYGPKDIYVVTARPGAAQESIKVFLDNIGLNIPLENIITLEDGSPQAKADWFLSKAAEGYNDFYFADDSALNVQQVKDILSQLDVKSRVQQAIADKATRLDKEMNEILEDKTGIKADEEISDVRAKLEGRKKDKGFFRRLMKQLTITASADDFLGLVQYIVGKGETGTRQQKWIRDNLIVPYNRAEQELISAKINVAKDFNALKQAFPTLKNKKGVKGMFSNPLNDDIGVGPYNKSQAVRVYLWNKQGMEIPGISQADIDALVEAVNTDYELKQFADNIQLIQKEQQYPAPTAYWIAGDIKSDILSSLDKSFRKELLTEWKDNVDVIFSPKNMNKLEAAFGSKYVEALRDSLKRMETGSNRPTYQGSGSRQVNEMMDWLNGSVAVAMFLNMRSGTLQMLSNVNFINWGDNNIYAAAKAFLSKDYVPTVMELMNSDYLVNRRDGLKINVNEAELAAAAKKGGFKGMLAYLLDKGFVLTRIFDSLAIATGGATFYMNRQKSLLNRINEKTGKKYTKAEAKQQAFEDFYDIAEETQQSSNPSKISSQQASLFGRLILSFQNVTMQYNRKAKKMLLDLINRRRRPGMTQRESDLSNLSGVIYYVAVQNLVFNSLQQALFAVAFEDEEEKDRNKTADTINGMVDSLLFGLGFGGALISTVKNVIRELDYQAGKKTPEYEEALFNLFDISPVIDTKVRNIRNGLRTFSWNMADIKKRGWSLDNPAYIAISSIISGATNIPIDRLFRKINNIRQATDENVRTFERVALLLGWNGWNFGLPYWGRESTIKKEEKELERLKKRFKAQVEYAKSNGFTKRVPFTGAKSWKNGIPKGLKEGVDYIAIERYDGIIQYYKKP